MFFHFSCFLGHLRPQHTAVENSVRNLVNVSVSLEVNQDKKMLLWWLIKKEGSGARHVLSIIYEKFPPILLRCYERDLMLVFLTELPLCNLTCPARAGTNCVKIRYGVTLHFTQSSYTGVYQKFYHAKLNRIFQVLGVLPTIIKWYL